MTSFLEDVREQYMQLYGFSLPSADGQWLLILQEVAKGATYA
jgi:hypothetical protein